MRSKLVQVEELAKKIRVTSLNMAFQHKASHLGGAFSVADILAVLYEDFLNITPQTLDSENRDRFFYSKGHACTALYSVLKIKGFFGDAVLDSFTEDGSYLISHVSHKVPGVEFSSGSLGHLLPVAVGTAFAGHLKKKYFKTVCVVSDGELNEGSNWEAILFAAHHQLGNLKLIIDYNKIQSFGFTRDILNLEPLEDKFLAFNWNVLRIDGHNIQAIIESLYANLNSSKPTVIIADTVKGKGVSFMENLLSWHYKSPSVEEYNAAMRELCE